MTATGNYTDSTTKDFSDVVSWSSSSTAVATISVSGLVVGKVDGETVITAQQGNFKNSVTLLVNHLPTPTLTFKLQPTFVTYLQNYYTLQWSTTNATTCEASGDWNGSKGTAGNGNITPLAIGTYNYTLTCSGKGGSVTGTVSMKLTGVPVASVSGSLAGSTANISWGSTNYATYCVGRDSLASFGTIGASGTTHLNVSKGTYKLSIECTNSLGTGGKTTTFLTVP